MKNRLKIIDNLYFAFENRYMAYLGVWVFHSYLCTLYDTGKP